MSLVQILIKRQKENGGFLSAEVLQEISDRTSTPLYRLQELVSFYNSFRLAPPPKVEVQVCRDFSCHMHQSQELIQDLKNEFATEIEQGQVSISGKSCMGYCDGPVAVSLNHHIKPGSNLSQCVTSIRSILKSGITHSKPVDHEIPDDWEIDCYQKQTKYELLNNFLQAADRNAFGESVLKALEDSSLVGKGGPGARTAKKWRTVKKYAEQENRAVRYVVCNADESEPGTFKDRELLLRTPHLVLEGIITAALIIGAERAYIYIRHEYESQIEAFQRCIDDAKARGLCGRNLLKTGLNCEVEVFVSPGNYICGEQTAMIEAMEDKRAQPRQRPPDLEIQGYRNFPTLVNNVETFAWVPAIFNNGPDWYRKLGVNNCEGKRFVSLSGDINRPGVYEVPLGSTVGDLLELVGGMRDGQVLQAFGVSGPSGGFLPRKFSRDQLPEDFVKKMIPEGEHEFDLLNLPLDNNFFRFQLRGRFNLGAAHLFIGEQTDLVSLVKSCTEFYRNESCGKCVPCRLGSEKLVQIASRPLNEGKLQIPDYFPDLIELMQESSICGLGQVAFNPLLSLKEFFPETWEVAKSR